MADSQSPDTTDADDAEPTDGDGEQNDHHDDHGHGQDDHGDNHEHHDHGHHHAGDLAAVGVGVVTVSSSRSLDDDPSGDAIAAAFEADGHEVVTRELVRDDYDRVQAIVNRLVGRDDVNVVVTTGGTGVTPDDRTVEAVRPLLEKRLPGFGELFRRLSYDDIGTRVVGTRALAGVADGVPVFCLPGSENAATLGAEEIIVPETPHLAGLAKEDEGEVEGEAEGEE
ncbi:MogA/MoaB family molybdenum cofactor biosynthesis protein [Salarchaeum japonicum]|uniref:MogA/MoaB family molybdenum cofactor biosynthesis protein n=1 Tax=Salarchaeum japonicum TaxID=555573 RepID=UPI003C73BA2E